MTRMNDIEDKHAEEESERIASDLLHEEQQQALLEAQEVPSDVHETPEQAEASLMVKIKAVAKLMVGWEVGPLIRSTFTRAQSMELRGPSGSVYAIRIPLDFAAAVMQEEDMRMQDGDIAVEVRTLARSAYFERHGRYPSVDELSDFMTSAGVVWP